MKLGKVRAISIPKLFHFSWAWDEGGLWFWLSILPREAEEGCKNVPNGWFALERLPKTKRFPASYYRWKA